MRSGFAAIVGRPNVGKSTLLNRLVGARIAITSPKPQTTRRRILGIAHRDEGQVAFVDTPGLHAPERELGKMMNQEALRGASNADVIVVVLDAKDLSDDLTLSPDDERALKDLSRYTQPKIAVLSKIDVVPKPKLLPCLELCAKLALFKEIVPVSGRTGDGVERLLTIVLGLLPEGPPLFPKETFTDQSERDLAQELIREQVILHCRQEIPYSVAVAIESFDESRRGKKAAPIVHIKAKIYVERESQKPILIGAGGKMMKRIGTAARTRIERLLGVKVFLELDVRSIDRWTETKKGLSRAGVVS